LIKGTKLLFIVKNAIIIIVRAAIRRGVAENEVQKHEEKITGAWRQMSTLRQQYDKWCKGDDIEDWTHNNVTTVTP